MVRSMPTPTAELATERLGEPVADWIADERAAGQSWQDVIVALHAKTGLAVSTVTLRNWLRAA